MTGVRIGLGLALAYLLGALPVGYLITRAVKKVDIRAVGSGHTGGTNVLRVAGALPAALTILGDAAKGYAAVAVARSLGGGWPWAAPLGGIAAVLGHNYSIFLAFKGGVGTMATLGAALGLMPWGGLGAALVALCVIVGTRYASMGSLTFAALLPIACIAGAAYGAWPWETLLFTLVTGALSAWGLRANIRRLRQGTERKIGQRAEVPR